MDKVYLYPVIRRGRCGFIDAGANQVVDYQYDYAEPFSEGLAIVLDGGTYVWLSTEGRIIGRDEHRQFKELHAFHDGRAWVSLYQCPPNRAMNFGFIDRDGHLSVEGLANSREYRENLAAVSRQGIQWSYIDVDGNEIIAEGKGSPNPFSEGVAANHAEGRCQYIDKNGDPAIELPAKVYDAAVFSEGLARVLISKQGIGYINHAGQFVLQLDPAVEVGSEFHGGMAAVKQMDKWGYIDREGKMVIEPEFREAGDFSEGLASVQTDAGCGYIDQTGAFKIKPRLTHAYAFSGPLARAELAGKLVYLGQMGEIVWEEK